MILTKDLELYLDLITLDTIPSIINLLNHDNTNTTINVVDLLKDLTNE